MPTYERDKANDKKKLKRLDDNQQSVLSYVKRNSSLSISRIDKLIMNFIVKGMHPISLVAQKEFIELVKGLNPNANIASRPTLVRYLQAAYQKLRVEITTKLDKVPHLCMTADAWTCSGMSRSFLGVTIHWITKDLERKSFALACRRFKGSHTYDKIAGMLSAVMKEYNIGVRKVVKAVTDNGSNFVRAFKEFEISEDDDEEIEENVECGVNFVDLESLLSTVAASSNQDHFYELPSHQKCVAHSLSLICTTDISRKLPTIHRTSFAKCQALWNKFSRSTQTSEKVKDICGKSLPRPSVTRWNSLYDSVNGLMEHEAKFELIFAAAGVQPPVDREKVYLKEYLLCVGPLAKALDKLQGERDLFYGNLIPTLLTIERRMTELLKANLQEIGKLPEVILLALKKRFEKYLSLDLDEADAIVAAISHPFFKLRWIPKEKSNELRDLFITTVIRESNAGPDSANPSHEKLDKQADTDDFFNFENFEEQVSGSDDLTELQLREQCIKYLQDSNTDINVLHNYPAIKSVFLKLNTPLPSSAPVERLFSFGNLILRPNRRRLTDRNFEMLTLLKVNNPTESEINND